MDNGLAVFEGVELEILTKEDVNVEFNGECLFNGIQITDILGYSNGNRDIENHCDEDCIELITKDKLSTKMVLSLGQRGTKFINEDGVMDLIYNSKMPKAKDFKKKVRKIVKEVQVTGKYDSVEQQLKLIEDGKERNLKLTIYQLDGILKINPSDMLTGIMRNQKQTELDTYLQSKELKSIKDSVEEINNKVSNMVVIGDRKQFSNEVNSVARATGKEQSEVYTLTYKQLENEYGIDLKSRCENKKKKIQNERLEQGKKPLSPSTLKQKVNNLTIADEEELWSELGKCLFAVKNELLK
ncbi:hypothetical protein DVV91_10285 [Clostridium botulinum]|uniref:BRO-N domain-containing protein n=1 Tax=Clostridium botulinum TaxID=1491 RepID=UPI001967E91E|nr:Bro-N domain-containing protein [Clostridium botulinum]MBN1074730.1 hypothetical protein [Clostridium botulinum]